ncbi:MAG: hypothetical protein M0038_09955 [Pseudomonadota bacterium]|jgi:hypothetical protein|nr:hypothetical protein [Pseudomonadota bacterium]
MCATGFWGASQTPKLKWLKGRTDRNPQLSGLPGRFNCLSPLGQSLLERMAGLIDWADRRYPDIHDARACFDGAPERKNHVSASSPE